MEKAPKAVQIIKQRLYWISDVAPPKNISKSFYFNIDKDLSYEPFYLDFGPLNLGKTFRYVSELQKMMTLPDYKNNIIFHYTSTEPDKASNSAYLMGAYQIIILGYSAEKAYLPFAPIKLKAFRDASYGDCTYKCSVFDCLKGLEGAILRGWFNHKKFNLSEYEHYERVENGDLNWIIPNKFVAFSSPHSIPLDKYGNKQFSPADYIPIFKKIGVTMVIRLNNKTYEAGDFIQAGIKHHDLFFTDGTAPPKEIVNQFLKIVENQPGAIAVHCKAGLGRTGSLIACYAMKHYYFSAADFIGWIRIARPGSILGPQQHFLLQQQQIMKNQGQNSPIFKNLSPLLKKDLTKAEQKEQNYKQQMNQKEKEVMKNGEIGQGEYLMEAKLKKQKQQQQQSNKLYDSVHSKPQKIASKV